MFRHIEFRGKDEQGKWHYGNLFVRKLGGKYRRFIIPYDNPGYVEVIIRTLGQRTEYSDSEGQPFYEGDIMLVDFSLTSIPKRGKYQTDIVNNGDWFGIKGYRDSVNHDTDLGDYAGEDVIDPPQLTKIGNVHDDPKLAKMIAEETQKMLDEMMAEYGNGS